MAEKKIAIRHVGVNCWSKLLGLRETEADIMIMSETEADIKSMSETEKGSDHKSNRNR